MASTINASSAGIVETADTSGVLQLQTNGVQALNIDASQNVTIPKNVTITSGGLTLNSTIDWNGYTIPAPTGTTTTFLSNAGTWITPAGSGTGGSSILASNNTFTGTNTFNAAVTVNANLTSTSGYLIDTAGGGYAALQSNSVTVGNATTGMYYNGSNALGFQVNNTSVFGFGQSGTFVWNSYQIPAPSGSTSTFLRNDGTWASPSSSLLSSNNTFTGTNTFNSTYTYVGGSSSSTSMILENNSINWYSSVTGNQYNSIYYSASSTSLGSQQYVFNFTNAGSAISAFVFAGDGGAYKTGGGTWGTVSDARLKSNVVPLTGALAKISALNPVSYTWNYDAVGEPTVGFIAQDVQNIIPNAVNTITPSNNQKPFITDDKLLSIAWQNDMTAYLVGAIKELSATVNTQANEIAALRAKVGV